MEVVDFKVTTHDCKMRPLISNEFAVAFALLLQAASPVAQQLTLEALSYSSGIIFLLL